MSKAIGALKLPRVPAVAAVWVSGRTEDLPGVRGADLVEVRWDLFPVRSPADLDSLLARAASAVSLPLLFTARGDRERGGVPAEPLLDDVRSAAYAKALSRCAAVDVEHASREVRDAVVEETRRARKGVILSMHDFEKTPPLSSMREFVAAVREAGGDAAKVAACVRSDEEVERLCRLCDEAGGFPVIVVPMGDAIPGARERVLSRGSLLAYAAIGAASAPGQAGVEETVRRVRAIRRQ